MHDHIPMLNPLLAIVLICVSVASLYFHYYCARFAGHLLDRDPMTLANMMRRGQIEMGIDCLVMGVGMGIHNLDILPAWVVFWLGLAIVSFRIWILVSTIQQARTVYKFRWSQISADYENLTG